MLVKKQFIFLLLFPLFSLAQIKGQIVDSNNSRLERATLALFKTSFFLIYEKFNSFKDLKL